MVEEKGKLPSFPTADNLGQNSSIERKPDIPGREFIIANSF